MPIGKRGDAAIKKVLKKVRQNRDRLVQHTALHSAWRSFSEACAAIVARLPWSFAAASLSLNERAKATKKVPEVLPFLCFWH